MEVPLPPDNNVPSFNLYRIQNRSIMFMMMRCDEEEDYRKCVIKKLKLKISTCVRAN